MVIGKIERNIRVSLTWKERLSRLSGITNQLESFSQTRTKLLPIPMEVKVDVRNCSGSDVWDSGDPDAE